MMDLSLIERDGNCSETSKGREQKKTVTNEKKKKDSKCFLKWQNVRAMKGPPQSQWWTKHKTFRTRLGKAFESTACNQPKTQWYIILIPSLSHIMNNIQTCYQHDMQDNDQNIYHCNNCFCVQLVTCSCFVWLTGKNNMKRMNKNRGWIC